MTSNRKLPIDEELRFLRDQLKLRVDLGGKGEVTLLSVDQLKDEEIANVQLLTQYPQWRDFRKWYLINAKMLYEQSASLGKEEAYVSCRLAKCLMDMIQHAERINPEKSQPVADDPYDLEQGRVYLPEKPGDGLPLSTYDEE